MYEKCTERMLVGSGSVGYDKRQDGPYIEDNNAVDNSDIIREQSKSESGTPDTSELMKKVLSIKTYLVVIVGRSDQLGPVLTWVL